MRQLVRCLILAATSLSAVAGAAAAEESNVSRRWALLIGVNDYVDLADLNYAGRNAEAFGESLGQAGFAKERVFLLHDDAKEVRYRPSTSTPARSSADNNPL